MHGKQVRKDLELKKDSNTGQGRWGTSKAKFMDFTHLIVSLSQ